MADDKNKVITLELEQRCAVKFCCRLGKTGTETLTMLQQTYGEEAMKRATVFKWHKRFMAGRNAVTDEPRSGRPLTSSTVEMSNTVHTMIMDRKITLHEISERLDISYGSVQAILKSSEHLHMRRVCFRWIPHNLTAEQLKTRVEICLKRKQWFAKEGWGFLIRIITCDESWMQHYEPERKRQSMEWRHHDSPPPKKTKAQQSAGK